MQRKKAREGGAADHGTAKHGMHDVTADDRNTAGDGNADADAPEGVLVKAHDLAGERHAEGEHQQAHAEQPGEFTGETCKPRT